MELWQQLLLGGIAALALWRFLPAVRRSAREAPKGSTRDWLGLLLPIGLVVLFVLFLIFLV